MNSKNLPDTHLSSETDYLWPCYQHPKRQTGLRCYRTDCQNPVCPQCAEWTRVGYLCRHCKTKLEGRFFSATTSDHVKVAMIALLSGLSVGTLIVSFALFVPFFFLFFVVILGHRTGRFIGRLTHTSIRGRRGRHLPKLVANGLVAGLMIVVLFSFLIEISIWLIAIAGLYGYSVRSAIIEYLR